MSQRFEVGQRVRVTAPKGPDWVRGKLGTVVCYVDEGTPLPARGVFDVRVMLDAGGEYGFGEWELGPETMNEPNAMQELSEQTADDLRKRVGVDVAVVVTMRLGDDTMGLGIRTPDDLPYDCVIGAMVQLLGQLRSMLHEKMTETKVPT